MTISLVNKNVKILNEIFTTFIQDQIKKIIHCYEWLHTRDINIVQHTYIRQNNPPYKLIEKILELSH